MKGTLKTFSDRHGYGFILGENNEYFFAHKIFFKYKNPKPGDKVTFTPKTTEKGSRATNIRREAWETK